MLGNIRALAAVWVIALAALIAAAPAAAAEGLDGLLRRSTEDLLRKATQPKPPAATPAVPPPATPATTPAASARPAASVTAASAAPAAHGAFALGPPAGAPPPIEWAAKLGFRDWSELAVVGDLVVASNTTGKGGVFAVDAASGKLRWRAGAGNASSVAPATDATHAYFALGRPAMLAAFRLDTGKLAWSKPFAFVDDGQPVLVDGLLLVQSEDGFLYAFDPASGAERWKTQYARTANWCSAGRPAIADGVIYISSGLQPPAKPRSDYSLHAIDAKSGRELWRYVPLSEYPNNYGACLKELLAVGNVIVAISDEYLYGVDRASGRELYRVELLDPDGRRRKMHGLVQLEGYVYGMSERAFKAIDAGTGRTVWSLPGQYREQLTRTAVANGLVYFQGAATDVDGAPDGRGILHALDPQTRRLQWSFSYPTAEPWSFDRPVVANGAVYVATYGTLLKLGK